MTTTTKSAETTMTAICREFIELNKGAADGRLSIADDRRRDHLMRVISNSLASTAEHVTVQAGIVRVFLDQDSGDDDHVLAALFSIVKFVNGGGLPEYADTMLCREHDPFRPAHV